jgi:hypothetical protein
MTELLTPVVIVGAGPGRWRYRREHIIHRHLGDILRRGRGLGSEHRPGMSLARTGHLPRPSAPGPEGRCASTPSARKTSSVGDSFAVIVNTHQTSREHARHNSLWLR